MPAKLTMEEFLRRARIVHGDDTFDYSKFELKGALIKSCIGCKIHGDWWQTPGNHLSGYGCPRCAADRRAKVKFLKAAKEFEDRAFKVHGGKFGYLWSLYLGSGVPTWIHCPKPNHGYFSQAPNEHLRGRGCPKCGNERTGIARSEQYNTWTPKGWAAKASISKNFTAFQLYVVKLWNENEEFYKVGITYVDIKKRMSTVPYSYEIIQVIEGSAEYIFNLEKSTKGANRHLKYIPKKKFPGSTECLSALPSL